MEAEKPAVFDGPTITINDLHDAKARSYYLVHSCGSVVGWAVDVEGTRAMFHELREAKRTKGSDPERLESALAGFLEFEQRASEYGVSLPGDLEFAAAIPGYTEFFPSRVEWPASRM